MANESGDMVFMGNYRTMIDLITGDPLWQSSNPLLKPDKMELQYTNGMAAVADVPVKIAPYKIAINEREADYEEADELLRGSRRLLKSSGVSAAFYADANGLARKVLGEPKTKKKPENPDMSASEASKNHSVSQLSFENRLGNLRGYIQMLGNEPLYNPNEEQYKVDALTAKCDLLEARNKAVSLAFVPSVEARTLRDDVLYWGENSIFEVQRLAKEYALVAFPKGHPKRRAITALKFKRPGRR